jgi:hypothetical protein
MAERGHTAEKVANAYLERDTIRVKPHRKTAGWQVAARRLRRDDQAGFTS